MNGNGGSRPKTGDIIFERYRTVRLLKEGPGVSTFLATDLSPDLSPDLATESAMSASVVIKTAPQPADGAARMRLEHEAAVLGRMNKPGIVSLSSFGHDNGTVYLVTPFVPGTTLEKRLDSGPLDPRDVVGIGVCMFRALREAHDLGIIHRDVKPSNVIIDDGSNPSTATLIDFGLSRTDELDASLRDLPVGTALYMAPEQAGLLEAEIDERSDLYSVGAVLFECLSGRPPFRGSTLGEVLRQHLTEAPPDLRDLGVNVPRALDELVRRLLAKDPRDRYQSADGVLADLEEIADALDRGESEPPVVVGVRDRRRSLADPAFVGRDYDLAALGAELERARRGQGHVVLVEAESGGGKTRLLQEFAHRSAADGVRVYHGQGVDQAAQRPFEVLRGVAQGLLERWRAEPDLDAYVTKRLGDRRDAVCSALPELSAFLDGHAVQAGPEEFGENRTIEGLELLITCLGTPEHPAVLVLDDCQWADELTLKLLARWDADHKHAPRNVLVCVAFRSEEIGPGHVLRRIPNPIRLELEPLRTEEVRLLVESMAGPIPAEAITVVVELAEGSPFMAAAVLRGLIESGALVDGDDGWEAVPDALAEANASRRAGAFLARRLELLSDQTVRLLRAGAMLGKEFHLDLAGDLAGMNALDAALALNEARRRHMVWVRGASCAFVHDKVREAVLDGLDPDDRRVLHRVAAERITTLDADRVFEIAYHLDAAGEGGRALPFAIQAAELARTRHALASAQSNYEIAERASHTTDVATRLSVAEGLGDVLMLRGLYEEAAVRFKTAASLATDGFVGARILGKLGELAFKRGDVRNGSEALEGALETLGHRTSKSFFGSVVRLPWQFITQAAHSLAPKLFTGRRPLSTAKADADLLAVRLYDRLAYSYWFYRGPVPALWAHLRGLNLSERYPPTAELAKSMSTHVAALSLIVAVFRRRAIRFADRSVALWKQVGDLWGEGQALHFYGLAYYTTGRFAECIEKISASTKLLERSGDQWEANIAAWHIASSLYYLGNHKAAVDAARRVHRAGVEIGDAQARGFGLAVWSKASRGDVAEDLIRTETDKPTFDTLTAAELVLAEGTRLLGSGRPAAAADIFGAGIRRVLRAQMLQVYVVSLFPWRATALRQQVERTSIYPTTSQRRLRRRWHRAARAASLIGRVYPNDRAHAWREAAMCAAARGRNRRARALFVRSLAAAERFDQSYERAQTLLERGRIGLLVNWPEADNDLAAGGEAIRAIEGEPAEDAVTVSLLDRFDSVLVEGRGIASALRKEGIYDAVREAAVTLLRPERCVVLEVRESDAGDRELRPIVGSGTGEFSRTVAFRALDEGRPVVVSEADAIGEVSESLVLAGVRSSLAAPIFVRGRSAACFYLEHRGVGGLFGADEERIAEFIATLAGAALENAEGFGEIQELTRTLERRVAERTSELGETNNRLESTLEDLRRLDQLKTEFMAMAAHDLRTPLTVIGGFSSTLLDNWTEFDDASKLQFLDRINANTKRVNEFVENLLHFGRIESGEFSYDIRPFDLGPLIKRTIAEQSTKEEASRFSLNLPCDTPKALGDEERIWQVLNNLLSNAVKFSSPETAITIDVAREDEMIAISVIDHGPGIPADEQQKLFKKFARVERADGKKAPLGTGLGLYICKSIIEAQDGEIRIDSAQGEGATFTFTLPAALPSSDPARQG